MTGEAGAHHVLRDIWGLVKDSVWGWMNDRAPRKGAALAFYTIFSLAPVLIIAIALAGAIFGEQAARGEIVEQVGALIGAEGAKAVEALLDSARHPDSGALAALVGIVTLLIGATTAFAELKDGLDQIWEVPPEKMTGFWYFLRSRFLSFGLILGIGFLLLVSLAISAALSALAKFWGDGGKMLFEGLNFFFSFVLIAALFAAIYKLLPSVRIAWRDVWVGAAITALLFAIGKFLIGLYLGRSAIASSYGAAGSLILVLIWVYYSAQIFLLGAEFTKFYAYRYGSRRHKSEAEVVLQSAEPPPAHAS
jgi:membrane protein